MLLNGTNLTDRHNRPGVLQKVALQAQFINNGEFVDPSEVSSCTIFTKAVNVSPSSVLVSGTGIIDGSAVSSVVLMNFAPSTSFVGPNNPGTWDGSAYNPAVDASTIFRISTGKYVVILDGTLNLSGNLSSVTGSAVVIANTASAGSDYTDAWTVRLVAGSNPVVFINDFRLNDDNFLVLTEGLLITAANTLQTRHLQLDDKADLKITTEITVGNKSTDEAVRNLFKDSVITSAMVQIQKVNEGSQLPNYQEVSGYADTSATVTITSDNTIVFNWNTNVLKTWGTAATEVTKREGIGSPTGTFSIRVKYTILNETVVSPLMFFTIE